MRSLTGAAQPGMPSPTRSAAYVASALIPGSWANPHPHNYNLQDFPGFVLAVLPIVTALLLAALEQPPVATRAVPTIPIRGVLQRGAFLVAAATSMVAFAGMNLIGTSLPIQMTLC